MNNNTTIKNKAMQGNRSNDTKIEIILRKALWKAGLRYRIHKKILNTKPDIVFCKLKIAIFCDGDFWHNGPTANYNFHSNLKYWEEKIKRNQERDLDNTILLRDNGWLVLRYWESEILNSLDEVIAEILKTIENRIPQTRKRP